jgi:tetratricopeptide (TPR) repeat protein
MASGQKATLAAVAAAIYAGCLANGFVFDDLPQVLENPWIRDAHHLGDIFSTHVWAFAGRESSYYRPLMHVVYALAYGIAGPSSVLFHAINVLLHVVCTLGVFTLVRILVPDAAYEGGPSFANHAFLASLIFATHPVHVEAVAWVSGIPDLAMGAAFLAAVGCFVAAWNPTRTPHALHALGAACFLTSALFKEPGVTLPLVVAALDLARRHSRHGLAYWGSRYGALAVAGVVYAGLRLNALDGFVPHASPAPGALPKMLELVGVALWRYLAMLVVPYPLNVFQTLESATGLPGWIPIFAFPVVLGFVVVRRRLAWTAALAIFLVPLAPSLWAPALLPGLDNPWAERYAYLPSIGFVLIIAIVLRSAFAATTATARRACVIASILTAVAFAGATIARVPVWRDNLTLWSDATRKSPNAGAAHGSLGYALFARGEIDRAIEEYRIAIRLKPAYADAHLNLGVALATKGLHDAALASYAEAIRLQPSRAVARANAAISLSAVGARDEALEQALRAVDLQPTLGIAHHALGVALGNDGRLAEAAGEFRRALELDPSDAQSRANLERAEALLRGSRAGE